jgi:hypothetical protein
MLEAFHSSLAVEFCLLASASIRLHQACINRHALTTDQTFRYAAANGCLEQMPQQFSLVETPVAAL